MPHVKLKYNLTFARILIRTRSGTVASISMVRHWVGVLISVKMNRNVKQHVWIHSKANN